MDNSSVMGQMRSLWGMVRLYVSLRMILAKKRASNHHARIEAFEGHLVGVCEGTPARFFVTHRPGDDGKTLSAFARDEGIRQVVIIIGDEIQTDRHRFRMSLELLRRVAVGGQSERIG